MWSLAAKRGHIESSFQLGRAYASGEGVERDPMEAYHHYTFAAARGDEEAEENVTILAAEIRDLRAKEDPAEACKQM